MAFGQNFQLWLTVFFCCVILIVFLPRLVGSAEICRTRVWIRVFWSMSFGQSIMYCWVLPSSPVTE